MGRGNFKGGNVFAQNHQGGKATDVLGGTSTDMTSVVFKHTMKNIPAVTVTPNSDKAVSVRAISVTKKGFTIKATSSSLTGAVTYGWIAYDDSFK
jgi:hypothetical protein